MVLEMMVLLWVGIAAVGTLLAFVIQAVTRRSRRRQAAQLRADEQ